MISVLPFEPAIQPHNTLLCAPVHVLYILLPDIFPSVDKYFVVLTSLSLRLGDIGELTKAGSLHEYLTLLHDEGRCPVTSFWFGKEHVVSVCSPQAFKDTVKLTDRAGEERNDFY